MKAIVAVLPDLRRIVPHGHGWFTLWIAAVLIGLELFGRAAATADYHDVLAAIVFLSAASIAAIRHRKDPHPWLSWLGGWTETGLRRLARIRHEIGIDFRGDPPLPRKLPRAVPLGFLTVLLVGGLFVTGWAVQPDGWRSLIAFVSYDLYLIVIAGVWAGLITIAMCGVLLPIRVFEGLIETLAAGSRPAVAAAYILSVLFLSLSLPPAIPLGFTLLILLACTIMFTYGGPSAPAVVWKGTQANTVFTIPAVRLFAVSIAMATLSGTALIVAACGGTLFARPDWSGTMPLTATIGAWAAWFIPGIAGVLGAMVWNLYRTNPARRTPATLHLTTVPSVEEKARLKPLVSRWGWRLSMAPAKPAKDAVPIRLVPQDLSEAREFDPGWPLNVSLDDLTVEVVKDRLVRRDEIQLRRAGFRAFKKLFKRAGLQKGSGGAGVLFAPHWWFIDGLDREDDFEDSGDEDFDFGKLRRVGPTFDRVLPPRARQHWHAVLRATQIDLLFLEDGVSYKSFERVLRQILDIYDRNAGKKRAEDHLFRGIPKVKVMIHEYTPGQEFDPGADYPEPKFMELSRARVLHVFRDRGDQTELDEVPFDTSWEPEPVGEYS
jgi:hypothetical protein